MLRFILGKSGSGKTEYIYNQLAKRVKSGEDNIIMLIPDQSSFETEKALLDRLGAHMAKKVRVFGFGRLCDYVFEKTGQMPKNVLDEGTRGVIMSLALEDIGDRLKLFKPSGSLAALMLQTLSDCKKSSVTTGMLRAAAVKADNEAFKMKLNETALALDSFDSVVKKGYVDPLDDLSRLYEILLKNRIFDGCIIYVDSFSGFTAQQLKVIRLLMNQCAELYVALTLDPNLSKQESIFATSEKTMNTLKKAAKSDFIDIKKPVALTEAPRFKSRELYLLEKNIYRLVRSCKEPSNGKITVYSAEDMLSECEFAAGKIKELVYGEGMRYSDITIICHDVEPYMGILDSVLERYEIPCFMDRHNDIEVKPVIRLIHSIFRAVINNFEREDVISVLKTGLTAGSPEQISAFENYCCVWSVNRSGFKKEFVQNPSGFKEEFTEKERAELDLAENVRASLITPLVKFKAECADKTCRELAALLYDLLMSLGAKDALLEMYDAFAAAGDSQNGAEQIRIWNLFMQVLDKTVAAAGDRRLSLKRFYELVSIQIRSIRYYDIPQMLDSVTVTSAQRVRVSNHKAAFLIGCRDGEFPAVPHFSGVFSRHELNLLTLSDINLGDDFEKLSSLEAFMAYSCMTSPSERLYLSFPLIGADGGQGKPSSVITETLKAFPDIKVLDRLDVDFKAQAMYTRQAAFAEYARSLASDSERMKGLKEYFDGDEDYKNKSLALWRALDRSEMRVADPAVMKRLLGRNLRISASQIEQYGKCSFRYFCQYGLRVRERRRAEINPLEYGTLVHYVLEMFFKKYGKSEYSNISDEALRDFIAERVNSYVESVMGGAGEKTQSFMYRISVIVNDLLILLKHITEELAQSDFDVSDCELKIGGDVPAYTLKVGGDISIAITGSIDRVDIMKKDSVSYLRIIDYKTGIKTFELSDILYGLNLQMLLYMCALRLNGLEKYGDFTEAGVLYMPSSIIAVNNSDNSLSQEKIDKKLSDSLKMNGLVNSDITVVKGMDSSGEGKYIPVKIKSGDLLSGKNLISQKQFARLYKKIELTVLNMANSLYGGEVQASPLKGAHDGCEYCPYDSVCCYHMSEPRNTFVTDNEKVFEIIGEELNEGGES